MIGNKVCFFQTIPSTNDHMKQHLYSFGHGDIVCARIQTAGRGRRDRIWVSRSGNLHASLMLDRKRSSYGPFEVVMRTSLAIVLLLKELGVQAVIKYPNDIMAGGRKIAGILIEQVDRKYIVGIGVNVTFDDADSYAFHPTSILLETNRQVDYRDVLSAFIDGFNKLIDRSVEEVHSLYKGYSVVIDRHIAIDGVSYLVKDVSIDGELICLNNEKTVKMSPNEVSLTALYDES